MRIRSHKKSKPIEISIDEFDELVKKGELSPKTLIKAKSCAKEKWISIDNLKRFHKLSPIEYPPGPFWPVLITKREYERLLNAREEVFPLDESINRSFCLHLEYRLDWTFENTNREELWGFWCDGVYPLQSNDPQITKKRKNDTTKIQTIAHIGEDGQGIYNMTIRFGKYSSKRFAKGESLIDCIPSDETMDWVDIDIENKIIEIRLK
jgi:hypothetical protein